MSLRDWLSLFLLSNFTCVSYASLKFYGEVTVFGSPGNNIRQLTLCKGQRPEDAVADFLLRHGVHDDQFEPIQSEYVYLLSRLRANTSGLDSQDMNSIAEDSNHPLNFGSPFINADNRFITLYLNDKVGDGLHEEESSLKYPVYLRVGYSGSDHTTCVCSKIGCSDFEFTAIENYISSTLRAMNE